jgi:hypothetical protein
MLSFRFSDRVTKSADLSSEDSTQCMKDLFFQKLILNPYCDEGQSNNCESSNKSKLPSYIRLSIVALAVQSKDSVLTVEMFRTAKLRNVKGHGVTVVDVAVV